MLSLSSILVKRLSSLKMLVAFSVGEKFFLSSFWVDWRLYGGFDLFVSRSTFGGTWLLNVWALGRGSNTESESSILSLTMLPVGLSSTGNSKSNVLSCAYWGLSIVP